jgi:hypothetical protein
MSSNHDDLSNRLRRSLDRGAAPELSPELVTEASTRTAPHLTTPARTLRIAGSAGLAIAAVTVGALVVVPALSPRAPLFTAASASSAPLGARDAVSSSMKIGWWVDYHYTASASLSTEGGSGQVYRLTLDGSDPEERTAELATALGVDGTPVKADYSDETYPTWIVGPQDGTATNLSFSAYGTGDWWYSDPAASPVYVCDASVTPEQSTEYGCVLPTDAPANLAPTGDEARSMAQTLFASTGYTVDAADIDIYSDDWGTTATAYLTVDGQRTALTWNANWSNTGALSYAYGHSVSVRAQGTFDTVSPAAAVDRLSDGRWFGSAGPDFQGGIMFATDLARDGAAEVDAPTDAPTPAATDAPTETPVPTDTATETPVAPDDSTLVPVDPMPEPTPEVVEVTVDNATATLVLLWDVDGNAWLVPGYAMQMDEGWWNSVVSLVDGVIALPEPMEIEPLVLDPEVTN